MTRILWLCAVLIVATAAVVSVTAQEIDMETARAIEVTPLPLTHAQLHELESRHREREAHQGRLHHPDILTAGDLHPDTPILLAELDDSIPAFVVERQMVNHPAVTAETDAEQEHQEHRDQTHEETEAAATEDEDDSALIEAEFDAQQFGYGGGGYGGGGYGGGGYGGGYGKKNYKKVPYKKVPYKKVPIKKGKKGPPKKKFPPKKKGPPKKQGGYGGYGFGGGFGGHH